MKIPCFSRKHRAASVQLFMAVLLAGLLVFSVGTAVSASGGHEAATEAGHDEGAAHGEEGGHGEGAAHGKGWVATDTYRVLHFIVLAGGLFFLLKKPLSQALGARVKGIEEQLSDLEAQKAEAEKKLAEYNQKFAQLEKESEGIVAEYVRQGEEAKARILKEAEAAAEKLKTQAQKNIESEIQRAKTQLQEEILDKALTKAEALIKEKINVDDQEKLVDEYLAKVVAS
jgi:F-type H+-transporting ATPase subunit b